MSQMCTYCGKMVMGAHDCKIPESRGQGTYTAANPWGVSMRDEPEQPEAAQPEQPAPSVGTAREFLRKSDKFAAYDTNGAYLMKGYELESMLEAYASQAAPLPEVGLATEKPQCSCGCRNRDEQGRAIDYVRTSILCTCCDLHECPLHFPNEQLISLIEDEIREMDDVPDEYRRGYAHGQENVLDRLRPTLTEMPDAETLARKIEEITHSPLPTDLRPNWDEEDDDYRRPWIETAKNVLAALAALRKEKG